MSRQLSRWKVTKQTVLGENSDGQRGGIPRGGEALHFSRADRRALQPITVARGQRWRSAILLRLMSSATSVRRETLGTCAMAFGRSCNIPSVNPDEGVPHEGNEGMSSV